jgi:hypothetical protein
VLSNSAGKCVPVLLSVLVTTVAWSVPTSKSGDRGQGLCPSDVGHQGIAHPFYPSTTAEILELSNSFPANIAAELLKPPADSMDSPALSAAARPLPAVPGALFMVLTGFLCVSAVKDRKVWLAALASLLWVGHIGREMLVVRCPQVAAIPNTEEGPHVKHGAKPVSSRVERYLAPPFRRGLLPYAIRHTTYDIRYTKGIPQFAFAGLSPYPVHTTKRLAFIAERHTYFAPAFTFENLARGPPSQTWKSLFLFCNFDFQSVFAKTLFRFP